MWTHRHNAFKQRRAMGPLYLLYTVATPVCPQTHPHWSSLYHYAAHPLTSRSLSTELWVMTKCTLANSCQRCPTGLLTQHCVRVRERLREELKTAQTKGELHERKEWQSKLQLWITSCVNYPAPPPAWHVHSTKWRRWLLCHLAPMTFHHTLRSSSSILSRDTHPFPQLHGLRDLLSKPWSLSGGDELKCRD